MLILGIETSCDETALAILRFDGGKASVVAERISSQVKLHELYGGVVPELASREHLRNLPLLLPEVLAEAGIKLNDIDAIAVTRGPGLVGCLLMGLHFARGMALANNTPIVGVNHIEGHILAPMLDNPKLTFPYLALVVSGGHTEILEVRGVGDYKLIARTIDDAAGEAFDKSANLLGFPYPGGAALAGAADKCGRTTFQLPKVMREAAGFSFSGLKTAVSLLIKRERDAGRLDEKRGELAHAVQGAIVDALCFKLQRAIHETHIKQIAVTGGVSANRTLRLSVQALPGVKAYFPGNLHCMDNAAMIAYVGGLRAQKGEKLKSEASALSRWPVEEVGN